MESFPSFFFLLCKCGGHHLLCSPGAWPALSMSHVLQLGLGLGLGPGNGILSFFFFFFFVNVVDIICCALLAHGLHCRCHTSYDVIGHEAR